MSKGAIVGLSGGVLLLLVVGLSIYIGKLKGQIKDGEVLVAQITLQRDQAVSRAAVAGQKAAEAGKDADRSKALAVRAAQERDAVEVKLEASRAKVRELLAREHKDLPECMEGLQAASGHIDLLENELKLQSIELRHTKESLESREFQVSKLGDQALHLKEALRLEKGRVGAMEYVNKQKRKKRILGFTLGAIGIAGAGIAGGYALGVR